MQRKGPGGPGPPHFYTKLGAGGAKNLFWRPPPPPHHLLRVCVGYFDEKITLGTNY